MEDQELVAATALHMEQLFDGEGSGHDWWHIRRVWQMALTIGSAEKANLLVVQLAALLHDVADWKFNKGDEEAGPHEAAKWLSELGAKEDIIERVCQIIREVTFKGAGVETKPSSLEAAVVQDADRLDAIGAIGVGRAFAYGGHQNRSMYNPHRSPQLHASFEDYKKDEGATLNHFYEKLFLLKDRLTTPTGKTLAAKRHQFMEQFVMQFLQEWHPDGEIPEAFRLQVSPHES